MNDERAREGRGASSVPIADGPASLSSKRISEERLAQLLLLEHEILTQYVSPEHAPDERDRISAFTELQNSRADAQRMRAALAEILEFDANPQAQHVARRGLGLLEPTSTPETKVSVRNELEIVRAYFRRAPGAFGRELEAIQRIEVALKGESETEQPARRVQLPEVMDWVAWILPLAKGYAAAHDNETNRNLILHGENLKTAFALDMRDMDNDDERKSFIAGAGWMCRCGGPTLQELEREGVRQVIGAVAALAGERTDTYWAAHSLACEEILHRLQETWGATCEHCAKARPDGSGLKAGAPPPTCTYCRGNDRDMPCAYPSKGKPGCLRDQRLARK